MIETFSAIFVFIGATFTLISSIGIIRLPDFYIRTSAITKAATLGVASIMIGVAIHFNQIDTAVKAGAIVIFLLITSPIAGHIIGRAAYKAGVPLWEKTGKDEYKKYVEDSQNNAENKELV